MTVAVWFAVAAVAAVAVLIAVLALGVVRLRGLTRRIGSFDCGVRLPGRSATTTGVAVYGAGRIDWWRYWSVSFRPAASWPRSALVVDGREPVADPGGPDVYVVHARCGAAALELTMTPDAYAGLTSWLEAAPTNPGTVV
ncbi:DUF2550 family protein [Cellulomonas sp. PhB143]|uniref:DUF2550 family protein n=1 Tax=Cellulomonas sp. PhB143 TaxID=2485186 RepID=UPI000F47833F|nr:DUF2550 family protein [Cellulomonas sp. PhB143]ROS78464.1 uncharacterized protein DUF2550 [Cellulomonas sp. PhB143]